MADCWCMNVPCSCEHLRQENKMPFPPEVVARAEAEPEECPEEFLNEEGVEVWMSGRKNGVRHTLSVVADWMRSEKARELAHQAAMDGCDSYTEMDLTGWRKVSDAVISALLSEKEQG